MRPYGAAGILGAAIALVAAVTMPVTVSDARQFREINPIVTPEQLPDGAVRIERLRPVNPRLVKKAVAVMIDAWNTGRLDPMLDADRFYNKDRLLDTITEVVPRDARLKLRSIGGITTLDQYFQPRDGYRHQVSIVSAIVFTQIEFTDPKQGFIRLDGRNEFVIEIAERMRGS